MSSRVVHVCIRVLDIDRSTEFYGRLGFQARGRLNFESAYNVYLGLEDDGDTLELTVNVGRTEAYDLGDGYNHMALTVDDLDGLLSGLSGAGIEPEKPPYGVGGTDSRDGYRICSSPTPTDPGSRSSTARSRRPRIRRTRHDHCDKSDADRVTKAT